MTRYFLTRLQVEGFRGINNEGSPLDLRFKTDAVNSVFAPNALGKSSIFEALSFALKNEIPKLAELPAAEHAEDYYCNRFHSSGNASITLTLTPTGGGNDVVVCVERNRAGQRNVHSPTGHTDPEGLLQSLANDLVLLDHKTFLGFVEESPLKRGRAFSSLLGLSRLSEMRQVLGVLAHARNLDNDLALTSLKADVKALRTQVEATLRTGQDSYRKLIGSEPQDPFDFESMATKVLQALRGIALLTPHFSGDDLAAADFAAVREAIRREEQGDKRARLTEVTRSIAELEGLASRPEDAEQQKQLRDRVLARQRALEATAGHLLERLFRLVREILESPQWDNDLECPACDSALTDSLAASIDRKLLVFDTAREAQQELRETWTSAIWIQRLRSLEESPLLSIDPSDRQFSSLDDSYRHGEPGTDHVTAVVDLATSLEQRRAAKLHALLEEKADLEKDLPPSLVSLSEQVGRAEQLSRALSSHRTAKTQLAALENDLLKRERWASFIGVAASEFAEAEVALSTSRTAALENDYRTMYSEITKNPQIVPRLRKAEGSEDLFLRLEEFYGLQDLSANTLLAESYRNALALSIYLSAALSQRRPARFLVLDDVTSSFDAGHQFHLMELIRTAVALPANASGLQVVMLSHDGLLEKYFDRLSSAEEWNHTRLQGLPPTGMILTQAQEGARLRNSAEGFLNAGQTDQAVPLIRQYLEFKLLEIIRRTAIRVPVDFAIRDDRKMVGNCLDAISHDVRIHKAAGDLILDATDVANFEQVHMPALVANWISHYETGVAASLGPYVLRGVLDTVDDVAECFRYECRCGGGSVRRYFKSLTKKHCQC
jgi:DNA repair exonuclease SbcCD ATPase subunit